MAPFSAFPSEILALIVEYLSDRRDLHACVIMNKQLYQTTQSLLWQTPHLHDETTADQFYTALTMTCSSLTPSLTPHHHPDLGMGLWIRKLKLHGTFWNNPRLLVLIKYIPNVEDLCFTYTTELTGGHLALLPQQCSKLKTLRLFMVPGATQIFMNALGQHCHHQLTQLTLHDCYGLAGDTFTALQHCKLQTLTLGFIPRALQMEKSRSDLFLCHPWLTTLSLNFWQHASSASSSGENCGCKFMIYLFTDAIDAWPHLTSLSIADCTHWGTSYWLGYLVPFLQHHPRLQKLHFRGLRFWTLRNRIDFFGLTDVALPSLTQLSIINSPHFCADELKKWILLCPQLTFVTIWRSDICLPKKRGKVMSCGSKCHGDPTNRDPFLHHLDEEDIIKLRFGSRR